MLLTALLASKAAAAAVGAVVVAGTAAAVVTVPGLGHAGSRPSATASDEDSASDDTPSDDTTSPSSDESTESESADDAAPEGAPSGTPSPKGEGPDATGPAAFGLCTAWAHGGLTYAKAEKGNPAAKALVEAAGEGTVEDYCTAVLLAKKGDEPPTSTETATDAERGRPSEPGAHGRSVAASAKADHGKPDHAGKPSDAGKPSHSGTRP